jgi:hypothetical protein
VKHCSVVRFWYAACDLVDLFALTTVFDTYGAKPTTAKESASARYRHTCHARGVVVGSWAAAVVTTNSRLVLLMRC